MSPSSVAIFSVSGASATCTPTAACSTRGSWAASASTIPRGQTAAAARSTTTEEPGVWAPTSPYPKEQQIYVSALLIKTHGGRILRMINETKRNWSGFPVLSMWKYVKLSPQSLST